MESPLLWTLVSLQLVMGAFDILFHHEFTERLSWKPSAKNELLLHAARNGFYGLLFLVFAWTQPSGFWALFIAVLLLGEIVITLRDFVEEDLTRKLPASERVAHTLLAINYGAIMVLVLPVLYGWSKAQSGFVMTSYGWGSIILTIAAMGVFLFALHDILANFKVRALAKQGRPARDLAKVLTRRYRIVITGGTGFVGQRLAEALSAAGHAVIIVTRDPAKAGKLQPPTTVVCDLLTLPKSLKVDAIVNLAGESVANGLWTRAKRLKIYRSRLKSARNVARFIRHLETPPETLISASAVGFYGLSGDEILTEHDPGNACFSHQLTKAVEAAGAQAAGPETRYVALRIGLVLGVSGGLLANLLPVFDWMLGGPIGRGSQWMSWIERDDLVRLILHCVATKDLQGPVNAVAPIPVRNREFAKTLGKVLGRPALIPLPTFVPKYILGQMGRELLLGGQRVLPAKAEASGFRFCHPALKQALKYCLQPTQK